MSVRRMVCESCDGLPWQKRNLDKLYANQKKYRARNRDKLARYRRAYRNTEKGRKATLKAIKKYEKENIEKLSAWRKSKKINKLPCKVCGNPASHRHHPDYSKPLDVEFLCPLHHKQVHVIY